MPQWIDCSAYGGKWSVRTPGVDDLGAFLSRMDRWNIEVAAVTALRALADNTRTGNREIGEIVGRAPDRLLGIACINPMMGYKALEEMALCQAEGFRAIRLYPALHMYSARDVDIVTPVLRQAAEYGWPVYWTGCPAPGGILPYTPLDGLEHVACAWPGVPIVLSGYNYRDYYRIVYLLHSTDNVHLEISCYHGVEAVRDFTRQGGAQRVLLGTGYGLQYAGIGVGKVQTARIEERARAMIGYENARRLLHIQARPLQAGRGSPPTSR